MSRGGIALLLAAFMSSGCVPTNFVLPAGSGDKKVAASDDKKSGAPDAERKPARGPVTAGQVTPANAHDKAQELRDEMETDLLNHIETQKK